MAVLAEIEDWFAHKYYEFEVWMNESLYNARTSWWGGVAWVKNLIVACLKNAFFWLIIAGWTYYNAWTLAVFTFQTGLLVAGLYGGYLAYKQIIIDDEQNKNETNNSNTRSGLQFSSGETFTQQQQQQQQPQQQRAPFASSFNFFNQQQQQPQQQQVPEPQEAQPRNMFTTRRGAPTVTQQPLKTQPVKRKIRYSSPKHHTNSMFWQSMAEPRSTAKKVYQWLLGPSPAPGTHAHHQQAKNALHTPEEDIHMRTVEGRGGAFNREGSSSPIQANKLRMSMAVNPNQQQEQPGDISPILGPSVADRVGQFERRQSTAGTFQQQAARRMSTNVRPAAAPVGVPTNANSLPSTGFFSSIRKSLPSVDSIPLFSRGRQSMAPRPAPTTNAPPMHFVPPTRELTREPTFAPSQPRSNSFRGSNVSMMGGPSMNEPIPQPSGMSIGGLGSIREESNDRFHTMRSVDSFQSEQDRFQTVKEDKAWKEHMSRMYDRPASLRSTELPGQNQSMSTPPMDISMASPIAKLPSTEQKEPPNTEMKGLWNQAVRNYKQDPNPMNQAAVEILKDSFSGLPQPSPPQVRQQPGFMSRMAAAITPPFLRKHVGNDFFAQQQQTEQQRQQELRQQQQLQFQREQEEFKRQQQQQQQSQFEREQEEYRRQMQQEQQQQQANQQFNQQQNQNQPMVFSFGNDTLGQQTNATSCPQPTQPESGFGARPKLSSDRRKNVGGAFGARPVLSSQRNKEMAPPSGAFGARPKLASERAKEMEAPTGGFGARPKLSSQRTLEERPNGLAQRRALAKTKAKAKPKAKSGALAKRAAAKRVPLSQQKRLPTFGAQPEQENFMVEKKRDPFENCLVEKKPALSPMDVDMDSGRRNQFQKKDPFQRAQEQSAFEREQEEFRRQMQMEQQGQQQSNMNGFVVEKPQQNNMNGFVVEKPKPQMNGFVVEKKPEPKTQTLFGGQGSQIQKPAPRRQSMFGGGLATVTEENEEDLDNSFFSSTRRSFGRVRNSIGGVIGSMFGGSTPQPQENFVVEKKQPTRSLQRSNAFGQTPMNHDEKPVGGGGAADFFAKLDAGQMPGAFPEESPLVGLGGPGKMMHSPPIPTHANKQNQMNNSMNSSLNNSHDDIPVGGGSAQAYFDKLKEEDSFGNVGSLPTFRKNVTTARGSISGKNITQRRKVAGTPAHFNRQAPKQFNIPFETQEAPNIDQENLGNAFGNQNRTLNRQVSMQPPQIGSKRGGYVNPFQSPPKRRRITYDGEETPQSSLQEVMESYDQISVKDTIRAVSQITILHEHTQRAMQTEFGYQSLTDVQRQVLPAVMDFSPQGLERDVLVRARTGTGKTISFLVPMVERIVRQPDASAGILGMVLSPTRELAMQICGELDKLLAYHAMQSVPCIGGCSRENDVRLIRQRRTSFIELLQTFF